MRPFHISRHATVLALALQSVIPIPQRPTIGSVTPLPDTADPTVARVFAIGTASIFNGNVAAARKAALQAAYAEAVAMGAGTDIGRLTLIRNVRAVTDVVAARSRGFVRSYELIADELIPGPPQRYEVRIRAEVVKSPQSAADEIDGLRLFLEVIGNPTLLILLPERNVSDPASAGTATADSTRVVVTSSTTNVAVSSQQTTTTGAPPPVPAEPEGVLRAGEAAAAAAFAKYGYPVVTSDDLVAGGLATADQLARARQGVTADAIAVARAAGADLLLTGTLRTATQRVAPQGVEFVSATTEASAKVLVVSNGYLVDAFHRTVTKTQVTKLAAISSSLDAVAAEFASAMAWKLPGILTARPRVTHLVVSNVTLATAEKLKAAVEQLEGIDLVRFAAVPTSSTRTVDLELLSGYVLLSQDELVNRCAEALGALRVHQADKFTVRLSVEGS